MSSTGDGVQEAKSTAVEPTGEKAEIRTWDGIELYVSKQSEIIELQREIIDGLSACLLQHIAADDMPYLKEIHRAAELYQEL